MSRALDPQLHTHVVAANLARGRDGRFTRCTARRSIGPRRPRGFSTRHTCGRSCASVLAFSGVRCTEARQSLRDEACGDGALLKATRRDAPCGEGGGIGLGSKAAAESAALATRERKQYGLETHTWREEVRSRAASSVSARRGAPRSVQAGWERADRQSIERDQADEQSLGDHLAGPEGLTAHSNTFDERAVLQEFAAAARRAPS